ncbi:ATP-binding protein [Gordonia sp. CPCC 206044]|uniref:sensor histidine kinase n=1 Tax=Gordonia sp. CPCC 206044 TaxID=3140793 RepID=UPI003AF3BC3F
MRIRPALPRTLAGQAVASLLVIASVVIVGGCVLAFVDAVFDGEREAREQTRAVAVGLAEAPFTAEVLAAHNPTSALQPLAEQVRKATGVAFVTVMAPDGTRYTHPDPRLIGQEYSGPAPQLHGDEIYEETQAGSLGLSVRTVAPVHDTAGRVVGYVAAGITIDSLRADWLSQLPYIVAIGVAAVLATAGCLMMLRRRLLRQTGGLAPDELRLMYEHHDGVLHSVREGLIVVENGRPVLLNDQARGLLGVPTDQPYAQMHLPDFVTGDGDFFDDAELAYGGRPLVVSRAPVAHQPSSAVVTLRDRTELAAALGELDSMRHFSEALRSQAHESANRLHTVVALVEMGRSDEAIRLATMDLQVSQRLIDRMAETVTEPALAALLLGKTAQASERGISFTITEESRLEGDETAQLASVDEMITLIGNLVDNAFDAADPADPWVEVTVIGDATGLLIVVADSGPGMDPAEFERAQRRGYSTKPGGDAAGRGLGLALVAQVVAGHRGRLTAERTYGSVITVAIGDTAAAEQEVGR